MEASVTEMEHALAVRVHPEGGYGTDYTWCCVVRPEGDVAVIELVQRKPTAQEHGAAARALKKLGFRKARWERVRNGVRRATTEFAI